MRIDSLTSREDSLVTRDLVLSAFILLLVPVVLVGAVLLGAWEALMTRWRR